jgi:hypothetical protein
MSICQLKHMDNSYWWVDGVAGSSIGFGFTATKAVLEAIGYIIDGSSKSVVQRPLWENKEREIFDLCSQYWDVHV